MPFDSVWKRIVYLLKCNSSKTHRQILTSMECVQESGVGSKQPYTRAYHVLTWNTESQYVLIEGGFSYSLVVSHSNTWCWLKTVDDESENMTSGRSRKTVILTDLWIHPSPVSFHRGGTSPRVSTGEGTTRWTDRYPSHAETWDFHHSCL